jgi:hypothetical protein
MSQKLIFEDQYKKLGFETFSEKNLQTFKDSNYKSEIKVFYVPSGYELTIDFKHYTTEKPALFSDQPALKIENGMKNLILYYNRDFYCIQIHDKEVACDGLLFIMFLKFLL